MVSMRRTFGLLISMTVVAGLALVPTTAQGSGTIMPDLQIRGGPADGAFLGDGIYNDDGTDQTKTRRAHRGESDMFRVLVENDSDYYGYLDVMGDGNSRGFEVAYFGPALGDRPRTAAPDPSGVDFFNITDQVIDGSYTPYLGPGESIMIDVIVTAKPRAKIGAVKAVHITGASYETYADTVVARLLVTKAGGDRNGRGN